MYNDNIPYSNGVNRTARRRYNTPDVPEMPMLDSTSMPRRKCDGSLPDQTYDGSGDLGWGLKEHPLAMVYSPYNHWRNMFTPDVALEKGTMFAELYFPFEADKRKGGCC